MPMAKSNSKRCWSLQFDACSTSTTGDKLILTYCNVCYVSNKLLIKIRLILKTIRPTTLRGAHTGAELNACNFQREFLTTIWRMYVYIHHVQYMYSTHVFKLSIIHIMRHAAADRLTMKRPHNLFEFFSNV